MNTKYLIIGHSAAALGAVEGIRKIDKDGTITICTDEKEPSYARPFIVYYAAGRTPKEKVYFNNEKYLEDLGAKVQYDTKITKLEARKNKATTAKGEEIIFEKVLIATGGKAIHPPIKGDNFKEVIQFMTLEDADKMRTFGKKTDTAVVLGGGLIGLKATEALHEMGKKVVMVELADFILGRVMDKNSSDLMKARLEAHDVEIITKNTIQEILGKKGSVSAVKLKDGTKINCQMVVIAIGVTPNVDFIDKNEIEINRGVIVNEFLQTNIPYVYAAGDVAEGTNIVTGEKSVIAIWPIAKKQGYYAGLNMAGYKKEYSGGLVENVLEFENLPIFSYGETNVDQSNSDIEIIVKENKDKAQYLKLIIKNDILIGAVITNNLSTVGIYRDLIINKTNIEDFKELLIREDLGWHLFPKELRDKKLLEVN